MTNLKKRLLLVSIAVLILTMGTVSAIYAASRMQTVQAYLGVKIFYNGQELSGSNHSYIINNTTYVPLRMLMENFGKNITWDSANYRVVIADTTSEIYLRNQLALRDAEIVTLQNKITALNAQLNDEEYYEDDEDDYDDDISISDIRETLNDYFEDAGDDYFGDDGIVVKTITLSGDEDDLAYTIRLDFSSADEYDDLRDVDESDLEYFLDEVLSTIEDEIEDTDYEDAEITGRLRDNDHSSYYVDYEDGSYDYSWY